MSCAGETGRKLASYSHISVALAYSGRKHVFQDLEPYMCTYEDCSMADRTYATRHAFIMHEIGHHRKIARGFGCSYCTEKFGMKVDVMKHVYSEECRRPGSSAILPKITGGHSKRAFHIIKGPIADSICPFCAEPITGSYKDLTQHLGKHLEEVSFAVVRKPYEE
jgi:hypothetical protein